MIICFYLYKNALAKHTYDSAHHFVPKYEIVVKFPSRMYNEVEKSVERFRIINNIIHNNTQDRVEMHYFQSMRVENSSFIEEYGLNKK